MGSDDAKAAEAAVHNGSSPAEAGPAPATPPRDGAIDEHITAGDFRSALAMCAEAYAVPISRYCMAFTGSQAESETLVEETLAAASAGFPQYRGGKDVKAWIFGLARRICGRHVELRARKTGHGVTSTAAGENGADERARATRARAALSKLKPSEREAVVLRYEAGLSVRELAIACGVDEAQARKRISRGLVRLRAELGEE